MGWKFERIPKKYCNSFFKGENLQKSFHCILILFSFHFTDSPVCAESSVSMVGASLDESISISCRVNADPPDVEFEWSFSSSGERFEVPPGHYATVHDGVAGTDGSKSASVFYDSEETHGESDGMHSIEIIIIFLLAFDFFLSFKMLHRHDPYIH